MISTVDVVVSTFVEKENNSQTPNNHGESFIIDRSSTEVRVIEENMMQVVKLIESLTNEVKELPQEFCEKKEVSNIQLQYHDQLLLEHIRKTKGVKQIEEQVDATKETCLKK
ncbi:hypothetical protein ABEX44_15415 [Priestia megaterium]